MHNPDLNPYAPPETETGTAASFSDGGPQDYRIEKNVMILPPPFVLPELCFLTGAQRGLQRCEIPLKVMPRWWAFVMPAMMFSVQMILMFSSIAIQKLQLPMPSLLMPPLVGILIGFTTPAVLFTGILFVARKYTLTGFREDSDAVFLRRRRFVVRVLIFDFFLGVILVLTWLILPPSLPLTVITLISLPIAILVTLAVWQRNRKPWSRIGALQRTDGTLAVYGLDPSFLAVCRLGLNESTTPPASTRSA